MAADNPYSLPPPPLLILASTSRYRAELLARLQLPFQTVKPLVDETPQPGETCAALATRLAAAKARAGARAVEMPARAHAADATDSPGALVIGSDQVADLAGRALGKPGTPERAFEQLTEMRGQTVTFHTAIALFNSSTGRLQEATVATHVEMRRYSDMEIHHYLAHENALDCAGSAKSEGLGAALIAKMRSDDPTALVGLPLLTLIDMLAAEGVAVLR